MEEIKEELNESNEIVNNDETKHEQPQFDYRKSREERLIRSTEKRILKDLGVASFEDAKEILASSVEMRKELEAQRENGKKLKVFSAGFDDQFVDFVAHEVGKMTNDKENFDDALEKFKKKNSQFLRSNKIQMNSSPNFEKSAKTSNNNLMNDFIRGKLNKTY